MRPGLFQAARLESNNSIQVLKEDVMLYVIRSDSSLRISSDSLPRTAYR